MGDPRVNEGALLIARKDAAEARVQAALDCIQEAQALLDRAGQALCSVRGMATEWRRLGTLYEQVRGRWYAVDSKADQLRIKGRLLLDSAPTAHEAEWRRS